MRNKLVRKLPLLIASSILVLYALPFIFSGQDSNIIIHDNLDGNFVQYVVLAKEGKIFTINPTTVVEPIMNGMPRMFCINGLNIYAFLFLVVSPFTAWLINFILIHGIAFVGMYLFLRKYLLAEESDEGLATLVSVCFALVPFYTIFGLAVAGTPLLLYSFANLASNKRNKFDYGIIVLFAFYSSLVLVGFFIITLLVIWGICSYIKSKKINKDYVRGVLILIVSYGVVNILIVYQFFITDKFVSHRAEFVPEKIDFATVIDNAVTFFNTLHYHVSSPLNFLFVLVVFAIIFGLLTRHEYTRLLVFLVAVNMLIAFVFSVYSWEMLEGLWNTFPLTKKFQWNRFYFLSPLVWFIQLALSLKIIKEVARPLDLHRVAVGSAGIYLLFFLWRANTELRETTSNLSSSKKIGWSYKQFFDERLFGEIKNYINKPTSQYRVAALGMHPSVPLYNGFFTIDGYLPSYPLSYKREFRKIIADELEKPNGLKGYFDPWGNRCYLFPSELGYNFTVDKESNTVINDLTYDFNEGPAVHYILSAARIANPFLSNLIYLKSFENSDSKWRIHLYQVRSNNVLDDSNSVKITLQAQVSSNDIFQIFYVPVNASGYDEEHSISLKVKGKDETQSLVFRLPDTLAIKGMRLDVGNNSGQKSISLFSIQMASGSRVAPVNMAALVPNTFISLSSDRMTLREVGNRYDPYLELDGADIQSFNELTKNQENH